MNSEFSDAIHQITQDKGISNDLIEKVVEEFLLASYKKTFGTSDNAVVKMSSENDGVKIFAKRIVVDDDDLYDPVGEIELTQARALNEEATVGDEILVEIDPKEFDRQAVYTAKQRAKQYLRDIQKDSLYSEFSDKVNEVIIGYYQRERNGNIYVDLGRTEGILPRKNQSPRETYAPGSRIKSLIQEVRKTPGGLQIVLTRRDPEFVKRLFEIEVPEIYEQVIIIQKIVREAGYRTKVAVRSVKEEIDPIGACVGLKGMRIQAVMKELDGERIDILRWDPDPKTFIQNAMSPAQVSQVVILDESKHQALVVVQESQLSLAIGKQGMNVKLANRLCDWSIDVKTEEQFAEMDLSREAREAAHGLFRPEEVAEEGVITKISELEGVSPRVVEILAEHGIVLIETLLNMSRTDLNKIDGITAQDVENLMKVINENVEIVDEEGQSSEIDYSSQDDVEYEEEFECPECGHPVQINMTQCPNCGVGLSFEIEDEESEE
ncbi:MAG: transcription termination/antitermination protein NusA [Spirochaetales bacterium]|nr:transcription termination/antitermination protein NusA [Spirochaetales bacterium]